MSRKEENYLRENNSTSQTNRDKPLRINGETKAFVEEQCTKINEWVKLGALGKLDLAPCNSFKRFLLYQEVGKKFPRLAISKQESTTLQRGRGEITHLSIVKLAENEHNKTKEDLVAEFEAKLQESIGFRRVIDFIIDRRIPIVGHNCLIDLCHFFQKFIAPCPQKWSDFKSTLHGLFPVIVDTKHIASRLLGFTESSLESLTNMVKSKKLPGTDAFSRHQEHFHDAGYDSLCTGIVFIGLAELLKGKSSNSLHEYIDNLFQNDTSPTIINRLHAMQSDYPHFSLDSEDMVPDRSRVLYFGLPPCSLVEATIPASTDDIHNAIAQQLSNENAEVQVIWINPNSFFIIFEDLNDIHKLDLESLKNLFSPNTTLDHQFLDYSKYSKLLSQSTNVKRCLE